MREWTKTEADALPWGEVVEVRWPNMPSRGVMQFEPYYGPCWMNHKDEMTAPVRGSEWRRLERGEADHDGNH